MTRGRLASRRTAAAAGRTASPGPSALVLVQRSDSEIRLVVSPLEADISESESPAASPRSKRGTRPGRPLEAGGARSKLGAPARSCGGAGCHRCPGAPSGGGGPPRPPPVPLPSAARRQRRRPPLHQRRREAVVGTPAGDARIGCHRTGRRAPSGAVIVHGEPSTAASLLGALESRGSCWRRGWDRQRRQQLSRI